jgi:hypothetical protein
VPWPFEGGELELSAERGERRVILDWANEVARNPPAVPCAAFFADVDHAVREVTSGARVTVTWLLRRAKVKARAPAKREEATNSHSASKLTALLRDLASDEHVVREGLALRFACAHEYAVTPETLAVLPIVTDEETHALKGRDAVVARAALSAGLCVALAYFVWIRYEDGPTVDLPIDAPPTPKKLARLRKLVAHSALGQEGNFETDDFNADLAAVDDLESRVVGYEGASTIKLGDGAYSPTGYYGNEASDASYYVGAALDVVMPRRGPTADGTQRKITHPKFGCGTVVAVLGEGDTKKYRIRFASGEEKTLLARFVQ